LLIYGYWLYRHRVFEQHGKIMSWAFVLHLISIFTIMVPFFVLAVIKEYVVLHFFGAVSAVSLIHVPLGVTAATLVIWFVVSWRIQA
jgi:hypothetical protein